MFKDKVLLITGGTGSFGNAVVERFLSTDIKEIRILSRDEKKQHDMRKKYNNDKLKFYIGDVRNIDSVDYACKGVDYIFHAAALKQVPSCEFFPVEAILTNALGANNVLNSAKKNAVKKIVVLSTDKAVYPINAMGMTKALMEKIMIANSKVSPTIMCGTRYGNVMCTRGSVIPLFIDQIKSGMDITITNPDMTRFLMSLTESIELVIHAFNKGSNGDIFIQKAPACTILTLAVALLEIFKADNKIRIIGTRHGEKQHETLISKEELLKSTETTRFFRIPADNRDLNYSKYFEEGNNTISNIDDYTSENTVRLNKEEVIEKLLKLEYIQERLKEDN